MIILDTNVVSELFRPAPNPQVVKWLQIQPRAALFTTSLTRGEMLYGVHLLPQGRRKEALERGVLAIFSADMAGRVLPFDDDAADAYALIAASNRRGGRSMSLLDAMIAGVARSRGADLATRNFRDFEGCGINLINPWQ